MQKLNWSKLNTFNVCVCVCLCVSLERSTASLYIFAAASEVAVNKKKNVSLRRARRLLEQEVQRQAHEEEMAVGVGSGWGGADAEQSRGAVSPEKGQGIGRSWHRGGGGVVGGGAKLNGIIIIVIALITQPAWSSPNFIICSRKSAASPGEKTVEPGPAQPLLANDTGWNGYDEDSSVCVCVCHLTSAMLRTLGL